MRKIVPLVHMSQVDNYLANGVDAVLMGTYASATRQVETFTLDDMIAVNEKIPVIACFNRFYFEHELKQIEQELKTLHKEGIHEVTASDLAVLELIHSLDLDLKVILDTDTTMTNAEDVALMLDMGASEVVLGRELTLDEVSAIIENQKACGLHFFGYQLMSFSRRKHLSQYGDLQKIDIQANELYWLKEASRDDKYLAFEDHYGTHIYAPKVYSAVHAYPQLKQLQSIYFEVVGLDIEDVLFVVRNLDLIEDYGLMEILIAETTEIELTHGLLYEKTEQGK